MNILVMAGTHDAVQIIRLLSKNESKIKNNFILATTVTSYGAKIARKAGSDEVLSKPLDKEDLVDLIQNKNIELIIDATHPFAVEATKNAVLSSEATSTPYIRFERPALHIPKNKRIHQVESFKEAGEKAAEIMEKSHKNHLQNRVLHLAGVSTLEDVLESFPVTDLFVRVLPVVSSIEKCHDLGIKGNQIIAMQGTFSDEFNQSLMKEYAVSAIITKESGETGGVPSKINAALDLDIDVILVKRPEVKELASHQIINNLKELNEFLLK